jgi:hypothetical protein
MKERMEKEQWREKHEKTRKHKKGHKKDKFRLIYMIEGNAGVRRN